MLSAPAGGMQSLAAEASGGGGSPFPLPRRVQRALHLEPALYRETFLSILRGNDAALAAAAVRVLLSLLHSRYVEPELLDVAGETSTFQHLGGL